MMKNKFSLFIIYLISIFSISAMDKTIIIIQNNINSKDPITFSYKRHNLKNDKIYDNDTLISSNNFQAIALPKATEGHSFYTYYLNIPHAIPNNVTFKIGQNETIQSGNIIEINETDNYYTIYRKNQHLCTLNKQQISTTLHSRLNVNINNKIVDIKNLLSSTIQLKYSLYQKSRKRRKITEYIYPNENFIVLDQDVKLIIPIIFNKIILKKGYTTDMFRIQLSADKKFVEIISQNNTARFPLRTTMFNIDTQEIEPIH